MELRELSEDYNSEMLRKLGLVWIPFNISRILVSIPNNFPSGIYTIFPPVKEIDYLRFGFFLSWKKI